MGEGLPTRGMALVGDRFLDTDFKCEAIPLHYIGSYYLESQFHRKVREHPECGCRIPGPGKLGG